MQSVLVNGRILTPEGIVDGKAVAIRDGRIDGVMDSADTPPGSFGGAPRHDLGGGLLVPGFIDTQVNGGGGVLFNDSPTVAAIAAIGAAHRPYGTTGFLPTLISDDLAVVDAAMRATEQAIEAGVPGVLGVHIEGPFLNVKRKGIHDSSKFRTLDDEAVTLLSSLKRGRTLVTLAPETTTPEMVRRLTVAGVRVAAGHTNAAYATVRKALDAGLTGFTHLFNAMSPLASREPGVVGAALENQTAWCGIIVDGRHVDPAVLRIALRTRPLDRFMLVSDAMPTVGMIDKSFDLQGRHIRVVDGVCVDDNGTLAGSDLDMIGAVRNAMSMLGLSLEEAVSIASATPAAFLGLAGQRGTIRAGLAADLVLLDDDLQVRRTWIDGVSNT
jgi:N-acetylglucosamine-6-phosphate deacetylase